MKPQNVILLILLTFSLKSFSQTETKVLRLDSVIHMGANRKVVHKYNSQGNCIESTDYKWNNALMNYIYDYKSTYTYNSKMNVSLILFYLWNTSLNIWENTGKTEQGFDSKNQIFSSKSYNWDNDKNDWALVGKTDYENNYDSNNKLLNVISYANWTTLAINKYEFLYNQLNDLISVIRYNKENNEWKELSKEEFKYNSKNINTERIKYRWLKSGNSGNWIPSFKEEYTYDSDYKINQLMIPSDYSTFGNFLPYNFNIKEMLQRKKSYQYDVSWIDVTTSFYYYSDLTKTNIYINQNNTGIKIYPNPATDYITVTIPEYYKETILRIFDSKGVLVLNKKVQNKSNIAINQLNEGLYFYKIENINAKYSGKLFIKK